MMPICIKNFWGGGANKLKVRAIWSKLLDLFFSSSERLVNSIFVKIKPNFLSSGDIALASTLISTCLSTDWVERESLRTVQSHEAKHIKTILIRSNNKSGRSLRPKDSLKQANQSLASNHMLWKVCVATYTLISPAPRTQIWKKYSLDF